MKRAPCCRDEACKLKRPRQSFDERADSSIVFSDSLQQTSNNDETHGTSEACDPCPHRLYVATSKSAFSISPLSKLLVLAERGGGRVECESARVREGQRGGVNTKRFLLPLNKHHPYLLLCLAVSL